MRSLSLCIFGFQVAAVGLAPAEGFTKPNILFILADDLGYGDIGCQNPDGDILTPNIDSLAKEGVRFTNAYATASACAPSRAGLMTGRYQQRFGFEFDINAPPALTAVDQFGLPKSEPTLAERLKTVGYATCLVGKWHLGFSEGLRPNKRGFDSFFGFLIGTRSYLPGPNFGSREGSNIGSIWRNTQEVEETTYLTDAFSREACSFIESTTDKPFFPELCI